MPDPRFLPVSFRSDSYQARDHFVGLDVPEGDGIRSMWWAAERPFLLRGVWCYGANYETKFKQILVGTWGHCLRPIPGLMFERNLSSLEEMRRHFDDGDRDSITADIKPAGVGMKIEFVIEGPLQLLAFWGLGIV